jgi:hypothetical protein
LFFGFASKHNLPDMKKLFRTTSFIKKPVHRLHFILILLFSMLLFCQCSRHDEASSNSGKVEKTTQTTTINVIGHWLNEGKREAFVRNFAREYEFQNQNIKVNLKFPEEIYYNHLDRTSNQKFIAKTILEGNTDWDILRINGEFGEVTQILGDPDWAKKYLVDFSEIQEFREGTIPELLTDNAKAQWNGVIPGPWVEGQFWALWCNNKVAEKVGIEVKQFGMTFDDFAGYLKAVDQYNQKHPDEYITPVFESFVWETTMAIAINLYASLLDSREEFFLNEITETRLLAWEKTLEGMEHISKFQPLNPRWTETEWTNTTGSLLNEECLFYVNGSWMYNIWMGIDEQKTMNCMPAELPSFGSFKTYPGAYQITWGVLKNAPHREEAVKFLLAMNKPEVAETWGRFTKCPTGIKGKLSNVTFGGDQFENFSKYIQTNFGTNTYRYYASSAWVLDGAHAETPVFYTEVITGKLSAKAAMEKIRSSLGRK